MRLTQSTFLNRDPLLPSPQSTKKAYTQCPRSEWELESVCACSPTAWRCSPIAHLNQFQGGAIGQGHCPGATAWDIKSGSTCSCVTAWDLSKPWRPETLKPTCPAVDSPGESLSFIKGDLELARQEHPQETPWSILQLPREWEYQLNLSTPVVAMQSIMNGEPRRSPEPSGGQSWVEYK